MSFDLGIWSSETAVVEHRATQIYESLCKGERPAELYPNPAIATFYQELTVKWPEIDSIPEALADDTSISPWSCALAHSDAHVVLSCVWSKAEEVYQFVQDLALKHHLVFYDPQSDEVYLPE